MHVTCIGTGDAFGSGGRFNTCFLLDAGGTRGLVDCGATALVALRRHGVDPAAIDQIVLSHLHGDHFAGVPQLLLDARFNARRQRPVTIAGPPGVASRVEQVLDLLYPGTAETVFDQVPHAFVELPVDEPVPIGGWQVSTTPAEHGGGAPAYGLRVSAGGRVFAYSGDTAWTDALVALARDADVFFCECSTWDGHLSGHLSHSRLLAERDRLHARRMLLTHLGADMLARLDEAAFECAEDGMEIRC